jgi:hypothetical protein
MGQAKAISLVAGSVNRRPCQIAGCRFRDCTYLAWQLDITRPPLIGRPQELQRQLGVTDLPGNLRHPPRSPTFANSVLPRSNSAAVFDCRH